MKNTKIVDYEGTRFRAIIAGSELDQELDQAIDRRLRRWDSKNPDAWNSKKKLWGLA